MIPGRCPGVDWSMATVVIIVAVSFSIIVLALVVSILLSKGLLLTRVFCVLVSASAHVHIS
jgi:hypothetical protein